MCNRGDIYFAETRRRMACKDTGDTAVWVERGGALSGLWNLMLMANAFNYAALASTSSASCTARLHNHPSVSSLLARA
jgi:hypothetical protein